MKHLRKSNARRWWKIVNNMAGKPDKNSSFDFKRDGIILDQTEVVNNINTGGGQKKVATHKKWITWFIMAINEENVNKSYVFVLA